VRRDEKPRPSRVRPAGGFDPHAHVVTQRVMVATANDQNAVAFPGGVHPCQKARSLIGQGAQRRRDGGE